MSFLPQIQTYSQLQKPLPGEGFSTVIVRVGLILPESNTERIFKVADSVNFNGSVYLAEAGVGSEPSSV